MELAHHLRKLIAKRSAAFVSRKSCVDTPEIKTRMAIQSHAQGVDASASAKSSGRRQQAKRKPSALQAKAKLRRETVRVGYDLEPGFLSRLRN